MDEDGQEYYVDENSVEVFPFGTEDDSPLTEGGVEGGEGSVEGGEGIVQGGEEPSTVEVTIPL